MQSRHATRRIINAKDNFNLKKNSFLFKEYNFISVRISQSVYCKVLIFPHRSLCTNYDLI